MGLYELKELLVGQLKNSNYLIILIIYLISVITAVILPVLYMRYATKEPEKSFILEEENLSNAANIIIAVDISGAVVSPGMYKLDTGSRLYDLIKLAGGFSIDASEKMLSRQINLSQILEDSQKIYIPFKWDESASSDNPLILLFDDKKAESSQSIDMEDETITESGKINVNEVSADQLDSLPGIGPAYAQKIIVNRPYKNLEEFKEKSQVPSATIEKFIQQISF